MEENIIHEEKYEKEVVVCEETKIESEKNESVETIELVEREVKEKNKELCQLEILSAKANFEDLCLKQQIEEFQSLRKTLGRETNEIERKAKSELSVKNELSEKSEKNEKHLVRENK